MASVAQLMTADDLLRMPADDMRHELVRGELVTMPLAGLNTGLSAGSLRATLSTCERQQARSDLSGRRIHCRARSRHGAAVARAAHPDSAAPLPDEWRAEYLAANAEALRLANESLQRTGLKPADAQELVATVAALHGLTDLAMYLFLQGGVTKLSCPMCGEVIEFKETPPS
jgi:hypothetical protein